MAAWYVVESLFYFTMPLTTHLDINYFHVEINVRSKELTTFDISEEQLKHSLVCSSFLPFN